MDGPELMLTTAEIEATSRTNARTIGPHSRRIALGMIDGRRREAKLMRDVRDELVQHCGGKPSIVQRRLIDRAAVLALRLALMDAESPTGSMSERNAREYLCWHSAYVRTLKAITTAPAPQETNLFERIRQEAQQNLAERARKAAAASAAPAASATPRPSVAPPAAGEMT